MQLTTTNYLVNSNLTGSPVVANLMSTNPTLTPTKRSRHSLQPNSPGELGKLAQCHARELARWGWERFFYNHQLPTSINNSISSIPHPTAQYLHRVASAVVHATFPSYWTRSQCDQAIYRGPHPSASRQFAQFLLADMHNYVQMGYWVVLPYTAVRHYKQLRIVPAGVVPQRERRPRPIMDYTFYGTNQEGYDNVPHAAMQFGTTLQRILQQLVYCNPAYGPPLLAKIDLVDGYYRVPLSPSTALNLAVVIPSDMPNPSPPMPPFTYLTQITPYWNVRKPFPSLNNPRFIHLQSPFQCPTSHRWCIQTSI
jgi:hypothetical protein